MDFSDYIRYLESKTKDLKQAQVLERVATGVTARMIVRIFEEGKTASGGSIGSYDSSNELWVDPSRLPRKMNPRSKPGSNRTAKKTVYFSSYKALREQQGRESGFVNLRLTNDMQSDMANTSVSGNKIASTPKPLKVSDTQFEVRFRRSENVKKRAVLERKYGVIFEPSSQERDLFVKSYEKEIQLIYAK